MEEFYSKVLLMENLKLKNSMENVLIIGMVAFICSTLFLAGENQKLKQIKEELTREEAHFIYLLNEKQKRLTNYTLTAIELNNICDKFPSSKREKANNDKLQELLSELN